METKPAMISRLTPEESALQVCPLVPIIQFMIQLLSIMSNLLLVQAELFPAKDLHHTGILEYFNIKESALSNFAFQSFYIFIGIQSKKNFSNAMMHF